MYHRSIRRGRSGLEADEPTDGRRQRDKSVARLDGIDTETGKHRPRQVRHLPIVALCPGRGDPVHRGRRRGGRAGTVGHLVEQWAVSRVDVSAKTRAQHEWAASHMKRDLGAIRLDRLDRDDVARWPDRLASEGELSRRSIQVVRMVLRAALADAVENGELRRSPAAHVALPRQVAKPDRPRPTEAWTEDEVQQFLTSIAHHRCAAPIRLCVLYGLRRSEVLGLRWSDVDLRKGTVRIERAVVEVHGRPKWSDGKNARSQRTIPIDQSMAKALSANRKFQAEERLAAGRRWADNDLVVATRTGTPVSPGNFDQTLERLVAAAGVPRLTSHGLRHTAANHMVRHATDIGEIRAAADLLGHSPDMLMSTYAHALPESVRTVTDKIGRRAGGSGSS